MSFSKYVLISVSEDKVGAQSGHASNARIVVQSFASDSDFQYERCKPGACGSRSSFFDFTCG